mmetsp:Transcript_67951/g.111744  ORF Transcript_67951/g.111744 Transcript_67951/m.111744 type:complete len:86 (-) Transcript_67951:157-414(-)
MVQASAHWQFAWSNISRAQSQRGSLSHVQNPLMLDQAAESEVIQQLWSVPAEIVDAPVAVNCKAKITAELTQQSSPYLTMQQNWL